MFLTVFCAVLFLQQTIASIVINEIMYNHKKGGNYEYVELFNNANTETDVSQWTLEGVAFTLPRNTKIAANDYLVLANNRTALRRLYTIAAAKVIGDFGLSGALSAGGELLTLKNADGAVVTSVQYDDRRPWPLLADGGGCSLELRCATANPNNPWSWISSPATVDEDPHKETSGTPGAANNYVSCPAERPVLPNIRFTEIMYKPVGERGVDDNHEFVEIYNAGTTTVNLANFRFVSLSGNARFTFEGTTKNLAAGRYAIIAKDPSSFSAVYTQSSTVYGPFTGGLSNGGDKIALLNDNGHVVDSVSFDDKFPWPLAADALSIDSDMLEYAGNPPVFADWNGKTYEDFTHKGMSLQLRNLDIGDDSDHLGRWGIGEPTPGEEMIDFASGDNAAISYIPVVEDIKIESISGNSLITENEDVKFTVDFTPKISDLDFPLAYESVQIAYILDDPIFGDIVDGGVGGSTSGAVLQSTSDFSFTGYVIEEDRLKAAEGAFGTNEATYTFALASGRYKMEVQVVAESDGQSPFKVFIGNSEIGAWTAKLASTGFDYGAEHLHTVVTDRLFNVGDVIKVQSIIDEGAFGRFSTVTFTAVNSNELDPTLKVDCTAVSPTSSSFECVLPKQVAQSVVRYRVDYKMSGQSTVHVSPRPTDPMRYHGYFVDPAIQTETPIYHIFIRPDRWAQLQTEASLRRCNTETNKNREDTWGHKVPAVVVHNGIVMDCLVRFQGSRYNRPNGVTISRTGYTHPPSTGLFKAISWRIAFPPHSTYKGNAVTILHKMLQGCTMFQTPLTYRLLQSAGLAASSVRYVRTHVNGQYFRYQMELERGGSRLVERFNEPFNDRCLDHPTETVGDLYKAQGASFVECGYAWCNGRPLPAKNGYSEMEMLANTCGKKTHRMNGTEGHIPLATMFQEMENLNTEEPDAACRAWLDQHFDLDKMMKYMSLYNFAGAWDDNFHNYYPYQRHTDGKWFILPWDADKLYGEYWSWNDDLSVFIGVDTDPNTRRQPYNSRFKHTVISCHNAKYQQVFHKMLNTVLDPSFSVPLLNEIVAEWNATEASDGAGSFSQNFETCATKMTSYLQSRPAKARARLTDAEQAGNDQLTGDDFCFNTPKITTRARNAYKSRPGRPLDFKTTSVTDKQIDLIWTAPNPNGNALVSYSLSRREIGGAGGWKTIGNVPASTVQQPTFVDSDALQPETVYEYRVRALAVQFSAFTYLRISTPKAGAINQVPIVVTEVRANSGVENDFVELYNPLDIEADISGWHIVDNLDGPTNEAFVVPANTKIAPFGYAVFGEGMLGFRFSSAGEEVYVRRVVGTTYAGYTHGFEFGGSEEGLSLGRNVLSTGEEVLLQETTATPGAENAGALVGPIVIHKLKYAADVGSSTEYIVLKNVGDATHLLHLPGNVDKAYRIGGAGDYELPPGLSLDANEEIYISNQPAATLKSELSLPNNVQIVGPFDGQFSDRGERVTLRKPTEESGVFAEVDWLRYSPDAPWIQTNQALFRLNPNAPDKSFAIGPEPLNWGDAAPACSPACEQGGVCVRDNTCDCSDSNGTGATCNAPPLSCGDAMVQTQNGEECDGGACCDDRCKFIVADTVCRAAVAGGCDVAERCSGSSGQCPADSFSAKGKVCRPAAIGGCDVEETCTGNSATCPSNKFKKKTEVCRAKASACDAAEFCPGNGAKCPNDAFAAASVVCRAAEGPCDEEETCPGDAAVCPSNKFKGSDVICSPAAGPCDIAEQCTGSTAACPDDKLKPSGAKCRDAAGVCDLESTCTGAQPSCPANAFKPSTQRCRRGKAAVACDLDEFCTGSDADCPPDLPAPLGAACDDQNTCTTKTACDATGQCTGVADACECATNDECDDGNPCTVDTCEEKLPNGRECVFTPGNKDAVCRAKAGPCDVAERCDGISAQCPEQAFLTGEECREASGPCEQAAVCPGDTSSCPANPLRPSTFECRAAAPDKPCDAADFCDGKSVACADQGKPNGTPCDDGDQCTSISTCFGTDSCTGIRDACDCAVDMDCNDGNACTVDSCNMTTQKCQYEAGNQGAECRAAVDVCDEPEVCDGTSSDCPADLLATNEKVCAPAQGECDLEAKCSGTSASCPTNPLKDSSIQCRAANATIVCDAPEFCTGSSRDCPEDQPATFGTVCDDNDSCTSSSTCIGLGQCFGRRDSCSCLEDDDCDDKNPCSVDRCVTLLPPQSGRKCVYEPTPVSPAVLCRPSAGQCDVAEFCTGLTIDCPIDLFQTGMVCRNATSGAPCDIEERCNGKGSFCPANRFAGEDKVCREPIDLCDKPETCDGTSDQCPPDLKQPFGHVCREPISACDASETCDGTTIECPVDKSFVDGDECDDVDECTTSTVCLSGECVGPRSVCNCKIDIDCDDQNDCTTDLCVERECKYEFRDAGEPCSDGDACSIGDTCTEGGRCEGSSFCENNSICVTPGPYCQCPTGFGGLRCEKAACEPADLCGRGGECRAGNTCECLAEYEGERCETFTGKVAGTPIRRLEDIKVEMFALSQDLGGGLKGWTVVAIAASFLVLCVASLAVVAYLLKHFIVDSAETNLDDELFL